MFFYGAAGAVLFSSYRGQPARPLGRSLIAAVSPASAQSSRLQPQLYLLPVNVGTACGGEPTQVDPPLVLLCLPLKSKLFKGSRRLDHGSGVLLSLLQLNAILSQPDSEPSPVLYLSPYSRPSPSLFLSHHHPPRNVPILVARQHSHTTEAWDGILAEQPVIG